MQCYKEIHFKWLSKSIPCPDENLKGHNYVFYSECEINDIKYEIGIGAIVRIETKPHIGVIHYFYEIPNLFNKGKKYIVAIELFHKPKDIRTDLKWPVILDDDIEIVKKQNVCMIHVPVYALKSRCVVVYGLKYEDPHDLLHEFIHTTKDTIYVCRFIAFEKRGHYILKEAIYNLDDKIKSNSIAEISVEGKYFKYVSDKSKLNTVEISDEDSPNEHVSAGKFSVTIVENLKIKLRRAMSSGESNDDDKQGSSKKSRYVPRILAKNSQRRRIVSKKTQHSPSELMKNLTLSPKKQRELPSLKPAQDSSSLEIKENLDEHIKLETIESLDADIKLELPELEIIDKEEILSDDTDEDVTNENLQPVVVLNRIEMNTSDSSDENNSFEPTRSSRRQNSRISYAEFYEEGSSPEKRITRTRTAKVFDDYVVPTVTPRRKENLSDYTRGKSTVTFDETTPKKKIEEKQMTLENTPRKTRKTSATAENTPSKTRKQSVTFTDTPRKNKNNELEETNSVRQKRTVASSVEVTPKKQSRIMSTPKSGRLNIMTMTPTIEEREEPIVFCDTPMSRARMGLSAYSMPSKMPCRENEYRNIYSFVTRRLIDESSGCMYISGVPGTGKTMTVCRVMSDLSDQKDDYPDFVFLKLNALALTEPRQIYVEIVKKLINKKLHWQESLKEIERFFKAKKKKFAHVILVDELDKLCNRKQDVVYNLLDLPFHSVTPLIVITIANTMDLPERILTNKVNSRLGLVRLTFKPYQYKDLVKIVTERLATDAVFKNEALELVARKVAAVSGDARRALAMCSRATEIAEEENKDLVTMDVVDRVIKEMSSSSKVQAIKSCSKLEQLVLSAIANEVTRTGNEEVPFLNMLHNLEQLCLLESFKLPSAEVCLRSCHNLGSFRLLITQHGRTDINMTLMLNISTDDVHYAFRHKCF